MVSNKKKLIRFAEGRKLNFGKAENKTATIAAFTARFKDPVRTGETRDQFDRMDDREQLRKKAENGWIYRTQVDGGVRNRASGRPSDMISVDCDYATPEFCDLVMSGGILPGICYVAHTSRRHTPESPRLRIFVFLKEELDNDTYSAASRIVYQRLIDPEMEYVDHVSFRPAQMMFMPTVSKDGEYRYYIQDGDLLDWQAELDAFEDETGDWRDLRNLPVSPKEGELRNVAKKAEIPTEKEGPVGRWCRAYDVIDAIHKLLPDVYEEVTEQTGKPRYTYLGGTTTNGAEVQDGGLFLYSHHGSDPVSDMLVNSWDLVRIHLFGELDNGIDIDTPMGKRPSWKAMLEMAVEDPKYKEELASDQYDMDDMFDEIAGETDGITAGEAAAIDDLIGDTAPVKKPDMAGAELVAGKPKPRLIDEEGLPILTSRSTEEPPEPPKKWISQLEFDPNTGQIKNTVSNVAMILQSDMRLRDKIEYNEFKQERVLRQPIQTRIEWLGDLPVKNKADGDSWEDYHDDVIRTMIESPNGKGKRGYGIKVSDRDLRAGLNVVASQRRFHPVCEMLLRFDWDGAERVERVFIDYLGCPDDQYHRDICRLWFIAAVARVFEPGHKFDFVPILEGLQGVRKSTFIEILACGFFGNLTSSFDNPQKLMEELKNVWIAEIPELGNMSRSSVEDCKAFVSSTQTIVRMAYARNPTTFLRQQVYMGSTNKSEYLADTTGNRRWWPVMTNVTQIDTDRLKANITLIWAEAVYLYRCMRRDHPEGMLPLYLTDPHAKAKSVEMQESRRQMTEADHYAGQIEEYVNTPIHEDEFDTGPGRIRRRVSGIELWERALGNSGKFGRGDQLEVKRAIESLGWSWQGGRKYRSPHHGIQSYWKRPEPEWEQLNRALWAEEDGFPDTDDLV